MSHYTIDELIARWKNDELTVEQMIGQILLLLRELERRQRESGRESAPASDGDAREGAAARHGR